MTIVPLPPPVAKDSKAARSQFLELYGSLEVMNTYLKIAVLGLSLVCVGLVVLSLRTNANVLDRKPIVSASIRPGARRCFLTKALHTILRRRKSNTF